MSGWKPKGRRRKKFRASGVGEKILRLSPKRDSRVKGLWGEGGGASGNRGLSQARALVGEEHLVRNIQKAWQRLESKFRGCNACGCQSEGRKNTESMTPQGGKGRLRKCLSTFPPISKRTN